MSAPEFSRPVAIDTIGEVSRAMALEADADERLALARRFGLVAIDHLSAEISLSRLADGVKVTGRLIAAAVQSCVATAVPVPEAVDEPFEIIFRPLPANARPDEEIELGEAEMDVVFYDGGAIDLGDALAETLVLALDPYPRAPGADEALKAAGVKSEAEAGPFGALAGLRDRLKGPDRAP